MINNQIRFVQRKFSLMSGFKHKTSKFVATLQECAQKQLSRGCIFRISLKMKGVSSKSAQDKQIFFSRFRPVTNLVLPLITPPAAPVPPPPVPLVVAVLIVFEV